jgi:hypothetical protein
MPEALKSRRPASLQGEELKPRWFTTSGTPAAFDPIELAARSCTAAVG